MWIGTLAAAAAQVSTDAAALLNAVNGFCLAYLAAVARWSASLPGAVLSLSIGSPLGLVAAYLVPIGAVSGFILMRRRRELLAAAASLLICAAVLAGRGGQTATPPSRPTVTFLDVGQGDSTLHSGAARCRDAGRRRPGGVRRNVQAARRRGSTRSTWRCSPTPRRTTRAASKLFFAICPCASCSTAAGTSRSTIESWRWHARVELVSFVAKAGMVLRVGGLRVRVLSPASSDACRGRPESAVRGRARVLRFVRHAPHR